MSANQTSTSSCLRRRSCHFSGRVQGVGFRYTVQNIAMQYNVLGYVRNLRDGRVELVMEGREPEMEQLIDDVNRKMGRFIHTVECFDSQATGEFDEFYIRHCGE